MAGEIELLTNRNLSHVVGSNKDGLVGKAPFVGRPYWGLVADTTYAQGKESAGSAAYGKYRIPIFTKGPLFGAILRFANVYGTSESSLGTTIVSHMGLEYNGAWLGDLTFDNGSLTKTLTGTDVVAADACPYDVPAGVFAFLWIMASNSTGLPYCPAVQYRALRQISGSAITDNLGTLSTSGMSSAEWTFSPISIEGWTENHSVVLLENSRGIDGFGHRGVLAPGDVAPAIASVAAVANMGMGGQAMWQYGTDSTARNRSRDVLAPVATAVMTGDMINDPGVDIASIAGLYTKIFNNWDASGKRLHIAKTTDPYVTIGTDAISSLTQTGGVATATVASTANMRTGQSILIAGATPSAYNGTKTITVASATTFTFAIAGGTTSPATGTLTYKDGYAGQVKVLSDAQEANRQGQNYMLRNAAIDGIHYVLDTASAVEDRSNPAQYAPVMNEPGSDGLHVAKFGRMAKMRKAAELAAFLAGPAYAPPP